MSVGAQQSIQQNKTGQKAPESLLQLFWLMIKSFVLNIPKTIVKQLIKVGCIFIVVLLIHAYLVVVKNEGFSPDGSNKLLSITAFKGTYSSAVIFWTFAAFFLSTIISRIQKDGALAFVKEVGSSPAWLVKSFRMAGNLGFYRLMVFTSLTILASLLVKNSYTLILYALITFFSFTSRNKGFFIYIFKLGWSDWQKIFNRKGPKSKLNLGILNLQVFGLFLGFLSAWFIPYRPYGHIAVAILLMAGAIVLLMKKIPQKVVAGVLLVIGANVILAKVGYIFADDGGWVESGATLGNWIRSPGAWPAVGMGVPPGIGGAIGGLLGGLAGSGIPPLPMEEFELSLNAENLGGDGLGGEETGRPGRTGGNEANVGTDTGTGKEQGEAAGHGGNTSGQAGDEQNGGAENGETAGESGNTEGTGKNGESGDDSEEAGEEGESRFPEGTTSQVNPDGSITYTRPDGSTVTDHPDGWQSATSPDGTTATKSPDGVVTATYPDGTVVTEYPDGTAVQQNADGSTTTLNSDGSQTVTETDGTKVILHPDGKFTTVDEKGVADTFDSDGKLQSRTLPNGATGTYDEDGNLTGGTTPEGTPITVDSDGTMTMTTRDGVTIHLHPDGTISGGGELPDGGSIVINKNGTMDIKMPDGDVATTDYKGNIIDCKMTMPDGRVVDIDGESGTMTVTATNGDVATVDSAGNVDFKGSDGLKITVDSNGYVETKPDGSWVKISADGKNMTCSDGSSAVVNEDGSNSFIGADGTTGQVNQDGTGTMTRPDGTKWTTNADKSIKIEKTDGTVIQIGSDKKLEIKRPDGSIELQDLSNKT